LECSLVGSNCRVIFLWKKEKEKEEKGEQKEEKEEEKKAVRREDDVPVGNSVNLKVAGGSFGGFGNGFAKGPARWLKAYDFLILGSERWIDFRHF
jgi:hypothetical protein